MPKNPVYQRPPVVETVLSVQFGEIEQLKSAHFGLFFSRIRDKYPVLEEATRLPPIVEHFPRRNAPRIRTITVGPPDVQRTLFHNSIVEESDSLVQLQPDRLSLNWRKKSSAYPPYADRRSEFVRVLGVLLAMCDEEAIGPVVPNLCEVIYVNHIPVRRDDRAAECFPRVLKGLRWDDLDPAFPPPSAVGYNRMFEYPNRNGRLYAESSIGMDPSGKEFIVLKMTGRFRCDPDGIASIATTLDLAHECAIVGFESLTTIEAQRVDWGRQS